jgi:hypothetical protein
MTASLPKGVGGWVFLGGGIVLLYVIFKAFENTNVPASKPVSGQRKSPPAQTTGSVPYYLANDYGVSTEQPPPPSSGSSVPYYLSPNPVDTTATDVTPVPTYSDMNTLP